MFLNHEIGFPPVAERRSTRPAEESARGNGPAWRVLLFVTGFACVSLLFRPTFAALAAIWEIDPNYSHGYLVPLISVAAAIFSLSKKGSRIDRPLDAALVRWGLVLITLSLGLHWLCMIADHHYLFDVLALIGVLQGVVLILGGTAACRCLQFPIWFLLFMAPLPIALYQPLALTMQHWVSWCSALMLKSLQIAVYREGYLLQLPGLALEVGAACSGLRQLFAILAFCTAIGFFLQETKRFTLVLLLLSIPIAILTNVARVVLTGLILLYCGERWAVGFFHTCEGIVVIGLSVGLVLFLALKLRRLAWLRGKVEYGPRTAEQPSEPGGSALTGRGVGTLRRLLTLPARATILFVVLTVCGIWQWYLADRLGQFAPVTAAKLLQPLHALPLEFGPWRGVDEPIQRSHLYADQHLKRTYVDQQTGQHLTVWVTYSMTSADRNHHPEICMEVVGKPEVPAGRGTIELPSEGRPAQQYRFGFPGRQVDIAYWHYSMIGPLLALTDPLEKVYRTARTRPSSVTVEVFSTNASPAGIAGLADFSRRLDLLMRDHVGPDAVRASERVGVILVKEPQLAVNR